jgi:hypothetical protein
MPSPGAARRQLGQPRRPAWGHTFSPRVAPSSPMHALAWGCTPSTGAVPSLPIALPGAAHHYLGWHPRRPSPVVHRPSPGAACRQLGQRHRRPSPGVASSSPVARRPSSSPGVARPRLGLHAVNWGSAVVARRLGWRPRRLSPVAHRLGWRPRRLSPVACRPSSSPGVARPRLGLHAVNWGSAVVAHRSAWGCTFYLGWRPRPPSPVPRPPSSPVVHRPRGCMPSPGAACRQLGQPRCPALGHTFSPRVAPSSPVARRPRLRLHALAWACTPSTGAAPSSPVALPGGFRLGWRPRRPPVVRRPSPSPEIARSRLGLHAVTRRPSVALVWGCTSSPGAAPSSPVALPGAARFHLGWRPRHPSPSPGAARPHLGRRRPRVGLHAARRQLGLHTLTWAAPSSPVALPGAARFHLGWRPRRPRLGLHAVTRHPSVALVWGCMPSPGADATASPQEGFPSRPRVAALLRLGRPSYVWASWPCTWPRPCGVVVPQPPRPSPASGAARPHMAALSLPIALPASAWGCPFSPTVAPSSQVASRPSFIVRRWRPCLGRMRWPPPKEASPQDHGWQRCSASVDRLMCGPVGLAHGLDRAGLWCLRNLALGLGNRAPTTEAISATASTPKAEVRRLRTPPAVCPQDAHERLHLPTADASHRHTSSSRDSTRVARQRPNRYLSNYSDPCIRIRSNAYPGIMISFCSTSMCRLQTPHLGRSPRRPPPPKLKLIVYELRRLRTLKIRVSRFVFIRVGGLPQQQAPA